ncbi:MAG: biotin synthase BioB, partial [Rikenellaceae bacterium]
MNSKEIEILESKIKDGYLINFDEAMELLKVDDKELLCSMADRLRDHFEGNHFDTCSIINARSGKCSEDCKWCSQSKFHKTDISVYPMVSAKETMAMAMNNTRKGVGRFSLVTSGRALSDLDIDKACKIYKEISENSSIKLCASMGLLNKTQLKKLHDSGVTRYHCNLESAPSHFPKLCSTHTLEDKLQTIEAARSVGMSICSGGIIGMGETVAQRMEFAFYLRQVAPDSIPLNILNPIKGTPLADAAPLTEDEILTTLAMFRIINPRCTIRFAGGRGALSDSWQRRALRSG